MRPEVALYWFDRLRQLLISQQRAAFCFKAFSLTSQTRQKQQWRRMHPTDLWGFSSLGALLSSVNIYCLLQLSLPLNPLLTVHMFL